MRVQRAMQTMTPTMMPTMGPMGMSDAEMDDTSTFLFWLLENADVILSTAVMIHCFIYFDLLI